MDTLPIPDLRFDFGAIEALESEGLNLMDGLDEAAFRRPSVIAKLVWAGQLHARPDLTLADARAELARRPARDVVELVTAAMIRDMGQANEEASAEDAPPPPAQPRMEVARDPAQ